MPKAEDIALLESFCVDNAELERLETLLQKFNLFEAVGLVRQENKHSNFLAFLLDPRQPHGFGESILETFLQTVLKASNYQQIGVSPLHLHLWSLQFTSVEREWNDIDIFIENADHNFVVVIENKVNIDVHSNQLSNYRRLVERHYPGAQWKKVFVLLSPDGRESEEPYVSLSYTTLADKLESLMLRRQTILSPPILLATQHYITLLRRHLVTDPEIDKLCADIYIKHKDALDLIFKSLADPRMFVKEFFEEVFRGSEFTDDGSSVTYIHPFPLAWKDFSPKVQMQQDRRHLLHCLIINASERVTFHVQMGGLEGDEALRFLPLRQQIFDFAKTHPPLKVRKTMTGSWTRVFARELLSAKDFVLSPDDLRIKLDNQWTQVVQNDMPLLTSLLREAAEPFWSSNPELSLADANA